MIVETPTSTMPRIDVIWAFLSVDADGNEGVCARWHPATGWMPLLAADAVRLAQLKPIAVALARETGTRIRLVRFATREVLETIDGGH